MHTQFTKTTHKCITISYTRVTRMVQKVSTCVLWAFPVHPPPSNVYGYTIIRFTLLPLPPHIHSHTLTTHTHTHTHTLIHSPHTHTHTHTHSHTLTTHIHTHIHTHTHTHVHTNTLTHIHTLPSLPGVLTIPGSVPVNRRRSGTPGGASIDDNFLASMIFDTPTKPTSHSTTSPPSNLQKSPLHKSTSALNEMPMATSTPPTGSFGLSNKQHHPVSMSHSMAPANYQGHPPSGHEHAYSDNYGRYLYGNDPRFMVGGDSYADEYDLSPQGSLVSGTGSVFSPPNSNNTSRRSDHGLGLRESNLTDDILQHFSSARGHPQHHPQHQQYTPENHTHMTGVRSEASLKSHIPVPRKSNVSDSVVIPANSSPITRYKRASSPTLGFPVEGKAGYVQTHRGQREYSPDTQYPYHAPQQQPPTPILSGGTVSQPTNAATLVPDSLSYVWWELHSALSARLGKTFPPH